MPAWTPNHLNALTFFLVSTSITGLADGAALPAFPGVCWPDAGRNGYDFVPIGFSPPVPGFYHTNQINGLPVVRFPAGENNDGIDNDFQLNISQPFSVAVVGRFPDQSDVWSAAQTGMWRNGTNVILWDANGPDPTLEATIGTIADSNPHVLIGIFNGAASSGSVDGTASGTVTLGVGKIGLFDIGGATQFGLTEPQHDYLLVVCAPVAWTTAERQLVEGYAAHLAGIAANLPASHPYRAGPPQMRRHGLCAPPGLGLRHRTLKG